MEVPTTKATFYGAYPLTLLTWAIFVVIGTSAVPEMAIIPFPRCSAILHVVAMMTSLWPLMATSSGKIENI